MLKERYGNALYFFGGVNCESLISGTPEEVHAEVRYAIQHAAPNGGFVVTTSNVVQSGSRVENYTAMRQAVRNYGAIDKVNIQMPPMNSKLSTQSIQEERRCRT